MKDGFLSDGPLSGSGVDDDGNIVGCDSDKAYVLLKRVVRAAITYRKDRRAGGFFEHVLFKAVDALRAEYPDEDFNEL